MKITALVMILLILFLAGCVTINTGSPNGASDDQTSPSTASNPTKEVTIVSTPAQGVPVDATPKISTNVPSNTNTVSHEAKVKECVDTIKKLADELQAKNDAQRGGPDYSVNVFSYGCKECSYGYSECQRVAKMLYDDCFAKEGAGLPCFPIDEQHALDCANQEISCCKVTLVDSCAYK